MHNNKNKIAVRVDLKHLYIYYISVIMVSLFSWFCIKHSPNNLRRSDYALIEIIPWFIGLCSILWGLGSINLLLPSILHKTQLYVDGENMIIKNRKSQSVIAVKDVKSIEIGRDIRDLRLVIIFENEESLMLLLCEMNFLSYFIPNVVIKYNYFKLIYILSNYSGWQKKIDKNSLTVFCSAQNLELPSWIIS